MKIGQHQQYSWLVSLLVIFLIVIKLSSVSSLANNHGHHHQVYIVYLGEHRGDQAKAEIEKTHHSYLHSVKGSQQKAKESIVYSYKNVINGFSALLTPNEASILSEMDGVVSVFHSHPRRYGLHTTRSWDFSSLLEHGGSTANSSNGYDDLLFEAGEGRNVVVGVIDTGIWPESESFNDEGMEPIPLWWNGTCESGIDFNASHCNRKIIGARYYLKSFEIVIGPLNERRDYRSPRDADGHGTHTASTVGGRKVFNASSLGGFANGTAAGGATHVRLAIYKVCWPVPGLPRILGIACQPDDMLAAMDDAISDGVQVISLSIGTNESVPYAEDPVAIGALHALKREIVVVCSAGNSGPAPSTVTNIAPWMLTVGASSIDREFPAPVVLGNQMIFQGQTIVPFDIAVMAPLVLGVDAEIIGTTTSDTMGLCLPNTLSPSLVSGKIVVCLSTSILSTTEVSNAGGVGAILINSFNGSQLQLEPHILPATVVTLDDGLSIINYTRTSDNPMATLIRGRTILDAKPAPVMAPFSSVGPNGVDPNILKPDITAPGTNILAAWSEGVSPTKLGVDRRISRYNILSGTSMSCPHVAAAAALLKAVHPNWSSAAIRSALMTTATVRNNNGTEITDSVGNLGNPFQYGAGHFQPSKAANPGLVYDATYTDYLLFLCSTGNNLDLTFACPSNPPPTSNLNYPSVAVSGLVGSRTVIREVTNVGDGKSSYNVSVMAPNGYSVHIDPTNLSFEVTGEKRSFNITIVGMEGGGGVSNQFAFGWYEWSDGVHLVRSPIVVSSA